MLDNENLGEVKQDGREVDLFEKTPEDIINDHQAELEKEGEPTPTDSPSEKKDEKDTQTSAGEQAEEETEPEKKEDTPGGTAKEKSEEDNVPFHKHPRFKELIDEKNKAQEKVDQLEKLFIEVQQNQNKQTDTKDEEIPREFTELFGENEEAWGLFKGLLNNFTQAKLDAFEASQEKAKQEAVKQQEQVNKWRDAEFQRLQDEGKEFDKDKLRDVLVKYQPTRIDESGEVVLDFDKAYELYKVLNKKPDDSQPAKDTRKEVRKKIVNDDTKTSTSEEDKEFWTPADFRPGFKKINN